MELLARPWIVGFCLAYLVGMVAIGLWVGRRTRTPRDYFIAGQRIGLIVTGLTMMSAAFSGFVFMGGPGLTYRIGVSSLWVVLPVGITAGLLCRVMAGRLRRLAGRDDVYTIPDAVRVRFGERLPCGIAAVAVALGSVIYLAAQLLAVGLLLQPLLGIERPVLAMALGLFVILCYSTFGGMVSGVYTDLAQGLLMLAAALAVFGRAWAVTGGPSAVVASISESSRFGPEFLEPFGGATSITAFAFFFVFGVGVFGQPQMLHKFYMIADPVKLRFLPLVLGGSQVVCLLIWIGIGMAVPALVAQGRLAPLSHPDLAAPVFLSEVGPEFLAGLAVAGVLAAIMSTADSFLNIASAAMVRDLPRAFGRPLRRELPAARLAVPFVGGAALLLAVAYDDLIALLGTLAFGLFAAALAPTFAIGLNWARATPRAATASMLTGLLGCLGLELAARGPALGLLPSGMANSGALRAAAALAASFMVFAVVGLIGARAAGADQAVQG